MRVGRRKRERCGEEGRGREERGLSGGIEKVMMVER